MLLMNPGIKEPTALTIAVAADMGDWRA